MSKKDNFKYPADFIAEGLDQTRGWFYSLHVIGNAVKSSKAFRNVVVNWLILAEDWKKMSKRLKNYPDPKKLLDKYWPDAFRLYVLNSPVVRAEPLRFSEKGVEQILKDVIIPLENVYKFLETYAKIDNFKHPWTQVWFIRHSVKEEVWRDIKRSEEISDEINSIEEILGLSEEGFRLMETKEFIEKIIRIDPDVIYTSNILRAKQTAEKIREILKESLNKDIEIKIIDDFWSKDGKKIVDIYKSILENEKWKKVLIVAHNLTFRPIWWYFYDNDDVLDYDDLKKKYKIDYLEVVKLPIYRITSELDKWILSEYYSTLKQVDDALRKFYLDIATRKVISFIDKLTNWYVRRSRRRFWAEGLWEDKLSAYYTLYEVLLWYLKMLAPFAPFITEYLYLKLMDNLTENRLWDSIHLLGWEIFSDKYVNKKLEEEISLVRRIIKLWLYIRAKNKIKVKQPLKKMEIRV